MLTLGREGTGGVAGATAAAGAAAGAGGAAGGAAAAAARRGGVKNIRGGRKQWRVEAAVTSVRIAAAAALSSRSR